MVKAERSFDIINAGCADDRERIIAGGHFDAVRASPHPTGIIDVGCVDDRKRIKAGGNFDAVRASPHPTMSLVMGVLMTGDA